MEERRSFSAAVPRTRPTSPPWPRLASSPNSIAGNAVDGTDGNVRAAIIASLDANNATPPVFGATGSPVYIDDAGTVLLVGGAPAYVGNGRIPPTAVGVQLSSSRTWTPYFLTLAGIGDWTASAQATAKGGYRAGPMVGEVFPAGIAQAFFDGRSPCDGPVDLVNPTSPCAPFHMTPGELNVPGGFGWLKFGAAGKCAGFGLGMTADGCDESKPYLQSEIGPPLDSHGCCTQVGLPGSVDQIGSLPGNKVSADCSYYINNKIVVLVAVWDRAGGTGSNSYYHIVGFTGFQITACDGGKDIEGVWRIPFSVGPTTRTPGFAGAPLAVQLVR